MITLIRRKSIIWFSRFHAFILQISKGRIMDRLMGLDMLLLFTNDRQSGQLQKTPLLYVEYDNSYHCAASFAGNDSNPQWFFNIIADPNVEVLVRHKNIRTIAKITSGQERIRAWGKLVEVYPNFLKYQNLTTREIPVVRFSCLTSETEN